MTTATPPSDFRTKAAKMGLPPGLDDFRTGRATIDVPSKVQAEGGRFGVGLMPRVSLISRGEALGHDLWIDEVLLSQVADLAEAQEAGGLKSRFTHPSLSADGTGKLLGRIHEVELDGDRVLGDLHFASSATATPQGNLVEYVSKLAAEDPAAAGLSISFKRDPEQELDFALAHGAEIIQDPEWGEVLSFEKFQSPDPLNTNNLPHARARELRAADFVDSPAANPDGLFDRQPEARQVDELLSYALGLTQNKPATSSVFGVNPDRAQGYLRRWMDQHGLTLQTATDEEPDMGDTSATVQPVDRDQLRAEFAAELNRYTAAFGPENGAKWFHDGVAFSEAAEKHIEALTEERDELLSKVEDLEKRLADVKLGEVTPIEDPETGKAHKTMEDFCQIVPKPSDN